MDIQYSADLRISKNRIMDIQKSIYGYQKIELLISKNRIMDIRKWGIKSKTAPHTLIVRRNLEIAKSQENMLPTVLCVSNTEKTKWEVDKYM